MRDADLDRILSKEEEILPSSGFAASVMEAVQREASAPPPIPFPWKRALPGLCATGLMLVSVVVASILLLNHGAASRPFPSQWRAALASIVETWKTFGGNWIALALVLSLASVKLSMRFASSRGSRPERT
jgi:H+/gluconate symporter-like permease